MTDVANEDDQDEKAVGFAFERENARTNRTSYMDLINGT